MERLTRRSTGRLSSPAEYPPACAARERRFRVKRAQGARLWDSDGNEYIDYWLGSGPAILGYGDARVSEAARKGIEIGGISTLATERESAVAERISRLMPTAEAVRFADGGSDLASDALRLAMSYARRGAYIVVGASRHGLIDAREYAAPLNDANALEDVLNAHGDTIGALYLEPIAVCCGAFSASADYLRDVRTLCDRFKIVLIIDESKTGFRVARGGIQELAGVCADLCILSSSVANGYPISALAGREDLIRRIDRGSPCRSRYTAHCVSLAAAQRTLEILDESDALVRIGKYGRRMREGMNQILSRRGIPHTFTGHPSMSNLHFAVPAPLDHQDLQQGDDGFENVFAMRLNALGILHEPNSREPWYISAAHDELCLAETLAKFEHAADAALDRVDGSPSRAAIRAR